MSDVGADADHIEIEIAESEHIVGKTLERLAGDADHNAAASLVSELHYAAQNRKAIRRAAVALGMDDAKKLRIGGFEAEEIAIRARFTPEKEISVLTLAQAKSNGERSFALDPPDNVGDLVGR